MLDHASPDGKKAQPKRRRARGSGSVYRKGRVWWISYFGPDGRRQAESSESARKGDAERLLQRRVGAREHNLPVIPRAEQYTFNDAAQSVIDDFTANGKKSLAVLRRRVNKHLLPYFGGRRLVGITRDHVTAYIAYRQKQGIVAVKGRRKGERIADVSNAEVNRELATLKRIFNFAIEGGRIASRPRFKMLDESAARTGFFEVEQIDAVLRHLPVEIQPVIRFGYITGWRLASEVQVLQWRSVDFRSGEVRIDAGASKNKEPRVFPMTLALRTLLEAQDAKRGALKKAGHIVPWVFWRMVADKRGGEKKPRRIKAFTKAWRIATQAAGCPGRICHDLRRTAVRNLVRSTIPERVAMMMTGHKTRSVFERYNIVSDGDLRDAARKLDMAG